MVKILNQIDYHFYKNIKHNIQNTCCILKVNLKFIWKLIVHAEPKFELIGGDASSGQVMLEYNFTMTPVCGDSFYGLNRWSRKCIYKNY